MAEPDPQGWASIPRWLLYSDAPKDAKLIYIVLSSHVGADGSAWPSYARLGRIAGVSRRQAILMVGWLVEHGLIELEKRPDSNDPKLNLTNVYRIVAGSAQTFPPKPKHTRAKRGGGLPANPPSAPPAPGGVVQAVTQGGVTPAPGVGYAMHPNEHQLNESQERISPQSATEGDASRAKAAPKAKASSAKPAAPGGIDAAFDRWYAIYPRHQDKSNAKVKFKRVLTAKDAPTLEELIDGARRYRDDPNRVPEFTAYPATWLSGGRWTDDPLPPRSEQGRGQPEVPVHDPRAGRPNW